MSDTMVEHRNARMKTRRGVLVRSEGVDATRRQKQTVSPAPRGDANCYALPARGTRRTSPSLSLSLGAWMWLSTFQSAACFSSRGPLRGEAHVPTATQLSARALKLLPVPGIVHTPCTLTREAPTAHAPAPLSSEPRDEDDTARRQTSSKIPNSALFCCCCCCCWTRTA